jgi:hypothetical protein
MMDKIEKEIRSGKQWTVNSKQEKEEKPTK